jgi:intracellular sulfur oxidation DsrE/DsrF family protein
MPFYKNILMLLFSVCLGAYGQKTFPFVSNFGGVYDVPEAQTLVNVNTKYKIVCDIKDAEKDPSKDLNKALELVARLHNLYALAGVKKENLEVVAVVHNEATSVILSDEAFMFEYKTKNPNTAIINQLAEVGVKFYVCGQSLRVRKLVDYKRNPNIKVAHGALLALSHFQTMGFSLLKL